MRWSVMVCLAALEGVAGVESAPSFDVQPGEYWQLDWQWREKKVPRTAFLKPFVSAVDASGRQVLAKPAGNATQRAYDPQDLNVQKWRVYAYVADTNESDKTAWNCSTAKITLPADARKMTLSVWRKGDPAEIEDVRLEAVRLTRPPVQAHWVFPQMTEDERTVLTDAELDAHLAKRAKGCPRLVSRGDRTDLQVNGETVLPRIYKGNTRASRNRLPAVSAYSRKGFNVFTIGISFGPANSALAAGISSIWRPDGSCDVEKVRREIREHLKRAPDAFFMLNFGVTPPVGWAEKHPTEIFRNEKGQFGIFVRHRLNHYRDAIEYDPLADEWPAYSYASEEFGDLAADFLERLTAGLEDTPEGKTVIGVYCCGCTDGQWLDTFNNSIPEQQAADYSDVAKRRFAQFRRLKYKRSDVDVEIPPPSAFWDSKKCHFAEHASTAMSDFREFYARATTQLRLKMAKGIKRGSRGRLLVGSYSPQTALEGYPLFSTTYSKGLFESPDYDFFAVVPNYMREHVDPVLAAIYDGTCVKSGKLYVSELDLRAPGVRHWGVWGSSIWAENHTAATFRRKALYFVANALTHGGTFHAYDMDGGWFATDESQATWQAANEMARYAKGLPYADERIALVCGERYWDFHSLGKDRLVAYQLREHPRDALARCGAQWSAYQPEDLLGEAPLDLPKVVVFAETTSIGHADFLELKRRYAKDGRVFVWMYRPGLFAEDGERIEKDLGITPAPEAFRKLCFADGSCSDPLMKGVCGTVMAVFPYYGYDYVPVCKPDVTAGWKALAPFRDSDVPALAVRRSSGFVEIYTAVPGGVTPQLLRNCLKEAELNPFVETDELSGYGSGLFYIVAQSDGTKRFRLPKGICPAKVLVGPAWTKSGKGYEVELKRGDIFVLAVDQEL